MFENMPSDVPFMVRGVGGYVIDNLRRIYGNTAVKVHFFKPAHMPIYDRNGNFVVD
jgi:hypothetical protein